MTPNKNRKVIFPTHYEKIDQARQVPPTDLLQNIEFPDRFVPPLNFQKKISPN